MEETVSTADLLCLHLLEVEGDGDDVAARSTPGVLEVLDVGEGAITGHFDVISGLSSLVDRGLVTERSAAVADFDEERTVYDLTPEGREHAREVRSRLADRTVTVETAERTDSTTLADAADRLDGSLARAAARVQDDALVLDDVEEAVEPERLPFVDRTDELAELLDRYEAAGNHAAPLVVDGEPGVGKTHLLRTFGERVADRGGRFLHGRSTAATDVPYGPVLDAFADLPPAERDRVSSPLTAAGGETPDDQDELEQRRRSLYDEVATRLATLSAERPLVVAVDDVQRLDRPTALLVAQVADELAGDPVAVVGTASPTVDSGDALVDALATRDLAPDRLTLGPFDREATATLVHRLVGTRRVPDAFVDGVHAHTGGNPLFVVESVSSLLAEGLVRPAADVYPDSPEDLPVPDTVEAAVATRLAGLDEGTRELVELASLVGGAVPLAVLTAASTLAPPAVRDRVEPLVDSQFWERDGEAAVRFVSDVVRETVRDDLSEERRRELHARLAEAYEASDRPDAERTAATARHYDRAGMTEAAAEASLSAAEHATDVYAHELAVEACERAVDCARELGDDGTVVDAMQSLGETYYVVGELGDARRCFRFVRERADDRERVGHACNRLGNVELARGNADAARECFEASLSALDDCDAPREEARVLSSLGAAALIEGDLESAREHFERAEDRQRDLGDRLGAARTLGNLGLVERKQGNYERAQRHHRRSLEVFRAEGDPNDEAKSLGNLGLVAMRRGDLETARDAYEEARRVAREVDNPRTESQSLHNLGIVERMDGNLEAAREYLDRSLELKREVGDVHGEAQALLHLSIVERVAEEFETAWSYHDRAMEMLREVGDQAREAKGQGVAGLIAWREGDPEAAIEHLQRCLDRLEGTDQVTDRERYRGILGAVELSTGDAAAGRERRRTACSALSDAGDTYAELVVVRHHLEAERAVGNAEQVRDLCERARSLVEGTDADLGRERRLVRDLCADA